MAMSLSCSHLAAGALLLPALVPQVLVNAQVANDDVVDFTTHKDWKDLRTCVQYCLNYVDNQLGCKTIKCICQPTEFQLGFKYVGDCSQKDCNTLDSVTTAQRVFKEYCEDKGYNVGPLAPTSSTRAPNSSTSTSPQANPTPNTNNQKSSSPSSQPTHLSTSETNPSRNQPSKTSSSDTSPSDNPESSTAKDESKSGGRGKDFGTAEIIGTVVGILALIVAILTLWVNWKKKKSKDAIARAVSVSNRPKGGKGEILPLTNTITPPPADLGDDMGSGRAMGEQIATGGGNGYGLGYGYTGQEYGQPHVYYGDHRGYHNKEATAREYLI